MTLLGRNESRLASTSSKIDADYQVADVTSRDQVNAAVAAAEERSGPISVLINNAGTANAAPFAKMDDIDWDSTLAVNLTGVFNCTKAVVATMLHGGFGRIVNIASTAALTGYAYVAAYCAAKHGVLGLTRALAREYATKGITVNAVCPGYTDTDIVRRAVDNIVSSTGRTEEDALGELLKVNPQRRLIQPGEVANAVIWLCGQQSITGQAISVNGGEVV